MWHMWQLLEKYITASFEKLQKHPRLRLSILQKFQTNSEISSNNQNDVQKQ